LLHSPLGAPPNFFPEFVVTDPDAAASLASARAARQLAGRLAGKSLFGQVIALSLWPLLEQALTFLVTFVDTVLAGHLDAAAVAAVGIAGYMIWLLGLIQSAVSIGATALISRAAGARHRCLANAALGQSLTVAAIAGVIMGAALFAAAVPFSRFVELTGPDLDDSILFLRILAVANSSSFLLFVGAACFRAVGNTVTPFRIMLAVNAINVAANCAFVLGPSPFGGHGVAGIAAATDVAWTCGAILMLASLWRGHGGIRLFAHRLALRRDMVGRIVRIGLPNLAEASGIWVAQVLVLRMIGQVGRETIPYALALHSVAVRIEAISYLPGIAMSAAAAVLTGQYLGAGDQDSAKRAVRLCWSICVSIMGAIGVIFFLAPRPLIAIVTDNEAILRDAPILLRICAPSEIFMATYLVLSQAMRAAGDTRAAMLLSYLSVFCVRLPAAYLLGLVFNKGLVGIWLALCGEVVFRSAIFALRFWNGYWLKAKV
jgi:putative MATE family efflux protein